LDLIWEQNPSDGAFFSWTMNAACKILKISVCGFFTTDAIRKTGNPLPLNDGKHEASGESFSAEGCDE
jgi:hypothetical protein